MGREFQKYIMHIDMDAFYASIEQRDNKEYKGKPVIIGGRTRGVVATCSYEARKFGIHSAMPIHEAKRKCPQGIYILPRMKYYQEVSKMIFEILQNYSPLVEMASIDEAYLDITGLENLFGTPEQIAKKIQLEIFQKTQGLTASVGIAPIKFLAKIASDEKKPHGLFILTKETMFDYLYNLNIQKIPGVGKKFVIELNKIGIKKCADVLKLPQDFLEKKFGKAGVMLYERANGIDEREVTPYTERKSESAETTLDENVFDKVILKKWLLLHAERIGMGLRKQNLKGRIITIKIKYADFKQITRQLTLEKRTNATDTIFENACCLLNEIELIKPVRLIGVGVSGFDEAPQKQCSLLDYTNQTPQQELEKRRNNLDITLDTLRNKYGVKAVMRGKLFEN